MRGTIAWALVALTLGGCNLLFNPEDHLGNGLDGAVRDAGSDGGGLDGCTGNLYFRDMDDDGFGDPASMTSACTAPAGFVDNADDCDDADGARSPSATEICDGVDNDCDDAEDDGAATDLCEAVANGAPECVLGACNSVCDPAFADCEAGGGCETPLGTLSQCTGCGEACAWSCRSPELGCNDPVSIAAGGGTTCAVRRDGTLTCWGSNAFGQVGIGTTGSVLSPTTITLPSGWVIDAATGPNHSCAILGASDTAVSGSVYCWGDNTFGQLGDGTTTRSLIPVAVSGLTTAVEIEAGGSFTCALTTTGLVQCWGVNDLHQLGQDEIGRDDVMTRRTPVTVRGLSGAIAIDLSENRACAAARATGVVCWGDGHVRRESTSLGVDAVGVATGYGHTCAIGGDAAYCWGTNDSGQVGNGGTAAVSSPFEIPDLRPLRVTDIAAGLGHTCARTADGGVYCWGNNNFGEVGTGMRSDPSPPARVDALSGAVLVELGHFYSCALTRSAEDATTAGRMWCWGEGAGGSLGIGTSTATVPTPTAVLAPL